MPKSNSRRAVQTFPFHCIWVGSLAAGAAAITLNGSGLATLSTRFLSVADAFQLFRYKSFKFRLHCANVSANQAAGFVPGLPDTSPGTLAQVMELTSSLYQDQTQTVPTEWCVVPVADLHSQFPWYRCIDGTAPANQESPGLFRIIGTGTDNFAVEFRCVVELKEPLAVGNTPAQLAVLRSKHDEMARAAAAKERDRLVSLLAVTATTGK